MRREHTSEQGIDPSLKFWFKGEQGRLVDEISGNPIIVNQNLLEWSSSRGAYLAKNPASYNPKYCAYCVCDTGITEMTQTVVVDVYRYTSGSNLTTLDTYPTRQASWGFYNSWLPSSAQWIRLANTWQKNNNNTISRRNYVNGVLKFSYEYSGDGTFNPYQGVTINYTNQWSGDWCQYYLKNLRWYNRVLTLDEIAAL